MAPDSFGVRAMVSGWPMVSSETVPLERATNVNWFTAVEAIYMMWTQLPVTGTL